MKEAKTKYELGEIKERYEKVTGSVWNLLNFFDLFILALDDKFTIQLCNISLIHFLGYDDVEEVLGKSWGEFLPNGLGEAIRNVHSNVIAGKMNYKEFTNEIISGDGKPYIVKWFNTQLNGELKWSFSIGMPILRTCPNVYGDIGSARRYFEGMLDKDQQIFESLRDIIKTRVGKMKNDTARD